MNSNARLDLASLTFVRYRQYLRQHCLMLSLKDNYDAYAFTYKNLHIKT